MTLDDLAHVLQDADERSEPRDEHVLAAIQGAVPEVLTSLVLREEAKSEAELVLARADAEWRQEQDEACFRHMVDFDIVPEFD